jgi:hypothetical protein
MADNKLELVVEVDADKANASIKSVNTGLSGMEQAAVQAARNASTGIDGMTASMVKGATAGNLLAESIKKGAEWIKEWTVGAAQYAAHTSRMEAVTIALAKAHGNTTGETNKAVEAIKRVGFSTQDALHAVDRLIVADLNLSKAEGLAKVAKDAAAIENITPGEALEKLLLAIESGASRGLRTMGIFVELQKEVRLRELQLGRTLEESEVKQIRYNAVMREAAKITGAHGAAASTAEAQMHALGREVNELREAVGDRFQSQFRSMIGHLRELIGFLKENADLLARFGQAAIWTAGAIATYAIAQKILGIAAAVRVLTVALAANPWTLLAAGVALGGALIYKTWKDNQDAVETATTQMRNNALRQDLISGKVKLEDARKQGYTDDQLREIVSGRELLPGKTWQAPDLGLHLKKEHAGPSEDDIRVMADVRKRQAEAEKQSADYYQRAIEERQNTEREAARARIADSMKIIESTNSETEAAKQALNVFRLSNQEYDAGVQKIREEERREIQQLSSFVDSKSGQVRHFTLAPETLSRIHAATREKIAAFDQTFNEEESRRIAQIWKALLEREQRLTEEQEQWQNKLDDQRRGARRSAVEQGKDIALVQLESVDARTIQDKLRVEAAKTAIEVNAIRERTKIELETIDARTAADIAAAERAAMTKGLFDEQYMSEIRGKIQKVGQEEKDALNRSAANEIDVAQFKGANTMRRTVTEQYQSIFDSLKRQAGSVFDALLTKSQSVWQANRRTRGRTRGCVPLCRS